jgi:glycosyltransferase involved in cell wall biosynthesis
MNIKRSVSLHISQTPKTTVSVIIPTFNQEKLIGECIGSLLCQSYEQELIEIIVVDNGSTDGTAEIVKTFPVKLIMETKRGPAAARNAGIKIAAGEILIFMDHDCFADRDFVAYHVLAHNHAEQKNGQVKLVAGGIAGYNTSLWACCDDICSWYTSHPKLPPRYETDYLPAANMSVTHDFISALGGFESGMMGGEDVVLCTKIRTLGYKILFEPRAKVAHYNRSTFRGFINHAKLWARDELDLRRKQLRRAGYGSGETGKGAHTGRKKGLIFSPAAYIRRYYKGISKIIKCCLWAKRFYVFFLLPFIVLHTIIFGVYTIKAEIKFYLELRS